MFSFHRPSGRGVVGLGLVCVALAPSAAHAGETSLAAHDQTVRPGEMVRLVATSAAGDSCRLRAGAYRVSFVVNTSAGAALRARVSPRAARGAHRLALRCSTGQASTRVDVARTAGNRSTRGSLFRGSMRLRQAAADAPAAAPLASSPPVIALSTLVTLVGPRTTPFPRPMLPASPQAQQWWENNQATVVGVFRNGQCTDWAQHQRPDILQGVSMWRYDRYGPRAAPADWDARFWVEHATDAGFAVGRAPAVGAILVHAAGSYGAGSTGHVSVVDAVAPDGSFAVSHMNAPTVGRVTQQVYSGHTAAAMAQSPGIAFIH